MAIASDENLVGARLVFLTSRRRVANGLVWMAADLLRLSARLLTRTATGILTLAFAMTRLAAEVRATLQFFATNLPATGILQPALLVLQTFLTTHATLFNKKRTSWAVFVIHVAIVLNLRVTTGLRTVALEATGRRLSTTWKGWSEHCTATMAANLVEDCLSTRSTGAFVAKVVAGMISTLERPATSTSTDVFSLETIIERSDRGSV